MTMYLGWGLCSTIHVTWWLTQYIHLHMGVSFSVSFVKSFSSLGEDTTFLSCFLTMSFEHALRAGMSLLVAADVAAGMTLFGVTEVYP